MTLLMPLTLQSHAILFSHLFARHYAIASHCDDIIDIEPISAIASH